MTISVQNLPETQVEILAPHDANALERAKIAVTLLKAGYDLAALLVISNLRQAGFNTKESLGFQAVGFDSRKQFVDLQHLVLSSPKPHPADMEARQKFIDCLPPVIAKHFKAACARDRSSHDGFTVKNLVMALADIKADMHRAGLDSRCDASWEKYGIAYGAFLAGEIDSLHIFYMDERHDINFAPVI